MKPVSTIFLRVSILLFVLFISACSSLKPLPSITASLPMDITKLESWIVRGKVLIKTDTENQSGYFYWKKHKDTTSFSLNTFIGTNILTLTTENNLSTLEFDGKVYRDTNPSRLVFRTTGIELPFEKLELWIRGQLTGSEKHVVRSGKKIKQFDHVSAKQTWLVKYSKYQPQRIYSLPMGVTLANNNTKLKLSISSWEF